MIRAAVAYALFWAGDLARRCYQRLMAVSAQIQGDGKGPWGPWFDATKDEPE